MKKANGVACVAQLVKLSTLGFGSGHDFVVWRSSPTSWSMQLVQSLLGILSFSAPPLLALGLSLSLSKYILKKLEKKRKKKANLLVIKM